MVIGANFIVGGPYVLNPVEVDGRGGLECAIILHPNVVVCPARLMGQVMLKQEAAIYVVVEVGHICLHLIAVLGYLLWKSKYKHA